MHHTGQISVFYECSGLGSFSFAEYAQVVQVLHSLLLQALYVGTPGHVFLECDPLAGVLSHTV